jgi:predicted ATPase/DNA-binding SARP family transcriptional activator
VRRLFVGWLTNLAPVTTELVLLSRVSYRDQEITRPRLRSLLALLADDLRAGCGTARLVDALWPDARPGHPVKALQVLVSQARAQVGADVIVATPVGYRLALREDQVDACAVQVRAAASARHSRTGDHTAALAHADAGLALWEGAAGDTWAAADPLSVLRAARMSTHRSLMRARALALARLGRCVEAVEPLTELVDDRPRDEEVLLELLRCEAATVGPSAALARYEEYRRSLRDGLGSDPGPGLRDLHRQLLRGETPPVRHGVAHEPNPLLGRDDDIAAVAGLLRTSRVTSIVGAGGLGKTRLAQVVSRRAEQRVVHLVALAGVAVDGDVTAEVASALGVGESPHSPGERRAVDRLTVATDVVAGIVDALRPGPTLLVLDNCEHVVLGVAELVRALVSTSEDLRVLTTSRAPLGLSSEAVYPLPELDLPTTVELFGQRARAARPGVDLPEDVVARLCGRLDGLPLAVELAAARVRVMSVAEIARRLDDRFALLRGGARDSPSRHRTLHAVIDWSWHLLEPAAQAAMRALSVFPDGCTADAAGYLLGVADVLPVLEQLVDQSLLKVTDTGSGTGSGTRFRMLETVREFGTARREEAGETERVTDRFLAWARDFGVAHHEALFGDDVVAALRLVGAEQDNLVQALRHAIDRLDGATVAATSAALGGLWVAESNITRVVPLAEQTTWVLSHHRPEPALIEASRTTSALSTLVGFLVGAPWARRSLVTLRRLPTAPPDTLIRAADVVLRAAATVPGPDLSALRALCDSDDPLLAGMANYVAGYVWESAGDLEGALRAATRMLAAAESQGVGWIVAVAHGRLGELCLRTDRGEEARRHLSAALPMVEEQGSWSSVVRVWWALALANLRCGAVDDAEHWLDLTQRAERADETDQWQLELAVRAEIQLARGDVEAGLSLWRRAAEQVRNTGGGPAAGGGLAGLPSWALEAQAVAVIAHAQHDRLDLVQEITGELSDTLSSRITRAANESPSSLVDLSTCGALLLALAVVDIDRGRHTGDEQAMTSGARMIALAESFNFPQQFQPTMSAARATHTAEQADRPAYVDAGSSYAALDRNALRAAASTVLRERDVTARDPS